MTNDPAAISPKPPRRSVYGRRKGRPLRPGRRRLLEEKLPALRIALDTLSQCGPAALFAGHMREFWLEIGFGGGEHLACLAERRRDIGILGAEPFVNGVARLLSVIEDRSLRNIRIHDDDARLLLKALPDASLAQVFILFPDPWPKARHRKRRFISPEALCALHRAIKPGGELRFASDMPDYVLWTLDHIRAHGGFMLDRRAQDRRRRPHDWPGTRYEAKAASAGRECAYLSFRRR
ncbi:MAG: tRNA (guanine(46)-N(7))-methyltransferase TrmB [Hyphomicrobiales bacterium]